MTPRLIRMKMYQPEEVMLSYLCGLAPVGETFEIERKHLMEDLGLAHCTYYYRLINRLIQARAIRRLTSGASKRTGVLVVLNRPEHVNFVAPRLRVRRPAFSLTCSAATRAG